MATARTDPIETELMDEPHIAGRRISVRTIHDRVEGRGLASRTVADRLDLDLAAVYRALAYYHEHPDEMRQIEDERERMREAVSQEAETHRPPGVEPPGSEDR